MHTGQYRRLPAPYPVPFWLQRVSLLRWLAFTMTQCTLGVALKLTHLPGQLGGLLSQGQFPQVTALTHLNDSDTEVRRE